jgi:hypothetical protein
MAVAPQRPLKGSRISTFYPIKNTPPLSTLDSAFQLQEFISLTIRLNIHDVSAIISIPDSRSNTEGISDDNMNDDADGDRDAKSEFAVDGGCWTYEQLRYVDSVFLSRYNSRRASKTARAGSLSPSDHDATAGMYTCDMS